MQYLTCKTKIMRNRSGLTLIELIVVLVILAVLVAIIIPRYNSLTPMARYKADIATSKVIAVAAMSYMTKNNVPTCSEADVAALLADGDWPAPQKASGGSFEMTIDNGAVSVVTAGGVVLWPNHATAVPANY